MKDGKNEANGHTFWYLNGKFHRDDGPAVEYSNGWKYWYQHGRRHRDNGPAVEHANGFKEWWLNGNELSTEEFGQWLMKKELREKLSSALAPKPIIKRSKL